MKLKYLFICLAATLIMALTGCSSDETNAKTSNEDAADTYICVFGITVDIVGEDPFEYTNEDAYVIGPVEFEAAVKDKDNEVESDTYTGILLVDFLDQIGVDEYSVISIESASGKTVELDGSRLDPDGSGFAWLKNGEKLDAENSPIMFVNNGRGPNHWAGQVTYITIIK